MNDGNSAVGRVYRAYASVRQELDFSMSLIRMLDPHNLTRQTKDKLFPMRTMPGQAAKAIEQDYIDFS